ncbi:SDR family NAD(P)-dependent oxidoreductase [Micromonospora sp. ALFpr18c]|uniref:SDR family NAD(P)-dependent oxidoreductase n=1 Tax=unclassified Micromonospora TaxID=2617518 RepID=UPI00124B410F|nr:SDR family NAD(P)-dependent oxidoreductase [Micromonospora sp. ALFpr18c]KAB1947302.1 SDR family NAD(P)-dependent oxidoreductase [Micromonospora sp. ALFpr18c]
MRILVTGGTGFIGSHTVAALHRAGHTVRLLVRDPDAVDRALGPLGLTGRDVQTVVGDVTDAESVRRAVDDCGAVLHAASVYSFDTRRHARMREVNVGGTEVVLDAAVKAGADPVVHVSSFVALAPTGGRPLDTDLPVGRPRERYMATKAAAEEVARRHQESGAPVVVTYPMATLGPHDPHLGDQLDRLRTLLRGQLPIWPRGGFPVGDVRDVADLHVAALRPGLGPRRLLAPGRYLSTAEFVATVRAVTGRRLPVAYLPSAAVLPVGAATSALQRVWPWHIPVEYGAVYTCHCDVRTDRDAPAPTRAVAETIRDATRWLHRTRRITRRQAGKAAQPD